MNEEDENSRDMDVFAHLHPDDDIAHEQVVPGNNAMTYDVTDALEMHTNYGGGYMASSTPLRDNASQANRQQRISTDSGYTSSPNVSDVSSPRNSERYTESLSIRQDVSLHVIGASPQTDRVLPLREDCILEETEETGVEAGYFEQSQNEQSPTSHQSGGCLFSGSSVFMDFSTTPSRPTTMTSRYSEPALSSLPGARAGAHGGARPKTLQRPIPGCSNSLQGTHTPPRSFSPNHLASLAGGYAALGTPPRAHPPGFLALSHGCLDLSSVGRSQDNSPCEPCPPRHFSASSQQAPRPQAGKYNSSYQSCRVCIWYILCLIGTRAERSGGWRMEMVQFMQIF